MLEFLLFALAGIGAVFVTMMIIGFVRLSRMRRRIDHHMQAAGVTESAQATIFGRASAGAQHKPAPGMLGMSDGVLVFVALTGGDPLAIERDSITSVSSDRQFMARTARMDLLVVTWEDRGMGDAVAFAMPNVNTWRDSLSPQEG